MSHDINHIMNAISEANRALQAEPDYKHRIYTLEQESEARRQTIATRELHIMELKSEVEALNTKLRSTEVARDEAQFHQLEAQDKADQAVAVFNRVIIEAQDYIVAVTPPPPVEPEVTHAQEDPTPAISLAEAGGGSTAQTSNAPTLEDVDTSASSDKGESEPDPTPLSPGNNSIDGNSQTSQSEPVSTSETENTPYRLR